MSQSGVIPAVIPAVIPEIFCRGSSRCCGHKGEMDSRQKQSGVTTESDGGAGFPTEAFGNDGARKRYQVPFHLKKLHDAYQVTDVQPLDFFPHTDHVETAVRLSIR